MRNEESIQQALPSLLSLISKSEKVIEKLAPQTWQHAMLRENLHALRLASALMHGETPDTTPDTYPNALRSLASMIERTRAALPKFPPGRSQHSLLQNRLHALLTAEARIRVEIDV